MPSNQAFEQSFKFLPIMPAVIILLFFTWLVYTNLMHAQLLQLI